MKKNAFLYIRRGKRESTLIKQKPAFFDENGLFVIICSAIVAILNCIFRLWSGRILSAADYGNLYSLLSLSNVATVAGVTFATALARNYALGKCSPDESENLFRYNIAIQLSVAFISFCALVLLKHNIAESFLVAFYVFLCNVTYYVYGMSQGLKYFRIMALHIIILPVLKVILIAPLLAVGLPCIFVFPLMSVAQGVTFIACSDLIQKHKIYGISPFLKKDTLAGFFLSLFPMFALAAFSNLHVIIVENAGDGSDAGAYCFASILCAAMLAVPGLITPVLVPYAAASNDHRLLKRALIFSEIISVILGIVFLIFKHSLFESFFGQDGASAERFVFPVFVMSVPLVAIYVTVYYMVSSGLDKQLTLVCLGTFALLALSLLFLRHGIIAMSYIFAFIYFASAAAMIYFSTSGIKYNKLRFMI